MNGEYSRKNWHNIFQLSQAVFRVTHLFPQDEILRRHLREKITEILYQNSQRFNLEHPEVEPRNIAIEKQKLLINLIHDFRGLLFAAKNCNFVDEKNLIILIRECEKIIENLELKEEKKNSDNFLKTKENYQNAQEEIKPVFHQNPAPKINRKISNISNRKEAKEMEENSSMIGFFMPSSRQQRIIDFFQKKPEEKMRLKEVTTGFKNIPPRTIRHDLKDLCDQGFLGRSGHGPGSVYFLVKK